MRAEHTGERRVGQESRSYTTAVMPAAGDASKPTPNEGHGSLIWSHSHCWSSACGSHGAPGHSLCLRLPHPYLVWGGGDVRVTPFCPAQNCNGERGQVQTGSTSPYIFSKVLLLHVSFSATHGNKYFCFGLYKKSLRKVRQMSKWKQ